MGPTASGKTDLALALAQETSLPYKAVRLISVDSAMIYRDMSIGTAKPTPEQNSIAPHQLIDLHDPSESYNVANFCRDAENEIRIAHEAGALPVLVGGTMMYFNALLFGLADMPAIDETVRKAIADEAREYGWPHMHQQLLAIDPGYGRMLHQNHSQRIARALEVYRASGKTMSQLRAHQHSQQQSRMSVLDRWHVIQVALMPDSREHLHERIHCRFQAMLKQGFVEEVEALRARGDLTLDMPSMRCVGYRQIWLYLEKSHPGVDYNQMQAQVEAATRQLAKRQLTWLKNWKDVYKLTSDWTDPQKNLQDLLKLLQI